MGKYTDIQNELIERYRVTLSDGADCYRRTHVHIRTRTICKWKQRNGIKSTFTLMHEIGHIVTTKSYMRRCEEEYHATAWAIEQCKQYGLTIPADIMALYQQYVYMEYDRGIRRHGKNYPPREALDLYKLIDRRRENETAED